MKNSKNSSAERIEIAIRDLNQKKMIILTDDPDRENEGDLVIPAENITVEMMNFMIRNGTGIVCLSLTEQHLAKLQLPLMVTNDDNTSIRGTPFTISVDAKEGITTGVSAADRTKTIQMMMSDHVLPEDLVKPGHVFPLQATDGGVIVRRGHTEGALDITRLAGLKPAAVLCELMNPDGTMMRGQYLDIFAEKHKLSTLSINDILTHRLKYEDMIADEASASLPIEKYGLFKISIVKEKYTGNEHVILFKNPKFPHTIPLVRLHSTCLTGDLFGSQRCDCNQQLHHALQRISKEGGMLIYLNQEGRGIGLMNKIKAYSLQENGYDTVDANAELGLPVDARDYHIAANILRKHNMSHIRLLTNNPNKINDLKKFGIEQIDIEPMPSFQHEQNQFYLSTKKAKLNHMINLEGEICKINLPLL